MPNFDLFWLNKQILTYFYLENGNFLPIFNYFDLFWLKNGNFNHFLLKKRKLLTYCDLKTEILTYFDLKNGNFDLNLNVISYYVEWIDWLLTQMFQASAELLEQHYADLAERPFFAGLVKYMSSGPVVAMVWQGTNVVKTGRKMLGETNPADSQPGTIRGDFCIEVGR